MILITGATGFLGQNILPMFLDQGPIRILARPTSNLSMFKGLPVEFAVADFQEPSSLKKAFSGVEEVVHLAAIIREPRTPWRRGKRGQETFENVNVNFTRELLLASKESGIKKFFYISNLGVRQDPRYPFLYSKWQGEELVRQSGIPWAIFRPSLIFGKQGRGFLQILAENIKKFPVAIIPGKGLTRFQPVAAEDVARCLLQVIENNALLDKTYDLGGPEYWTYEELMDLVMEVINIKKPKIHFPFSFLKADAWMLERILRNPPVTAGELKMLELDNVTELDVISLNFGFEPTSLRDAIKEIF